MCWPWIIHICTSGKPRKRTKSFDVVSSVSRRCSRGNVIVGLPEAWTQRGDGERSEAGYRRERQVADRRPQVDRKEDIARPWCLGGIADGGRRERKTDSRGRHGDRRVTVSRSFRACDVISRSVAVHPSVRDDASRRDNPRTTLTYVHMPFTPLFRLALPHPPLYHLAYEIEHSRASSAGI